MSSNCLLSPLVQKPYEMSTQDFYEDRKNYFNSNLKHKPVFYNNKPVYLAKHDLPGDECFEKFAIGGEKYHKRKDGQKPKYDLLRLQRLDWILEIVNNIEYCENSCRNIFIGPDKDYADRLNISCFIQKYKIVITLADNDSFYTIISACYMRQNPII